MADNTCYGESSRGPEIRAWLDGELTATEAASLAEHVGRCPVCQAQKREQEAAGDEIASAVRGMAASGAARERVAARLGRRPLPSWAIAAAAALVVTASVLGIAAIGWPGTARREPLEIAGDRYAPAPRREPAPVPPEVEAVAR
ncbi:MAG: zf-HC2 domain-containing protein, partial [Planctomycetes bacterium]|nr:zf-HC2 domain-containing protein [Planctomycetota bacterium]